MFFRKNTKWYTAAHSIKEKCLCRQLVHMYFKKIFIAWQLELYLEIFYKVSRVLSKILLEYCSKFFIAFYLHYSKHPYNVHCKVVEIRNFSKYTCIFSLQKFRFFSVPLVLNLSLKYHSKFLNTNSSLPKKQKFQVQPLGIKAWLAGLFFFSKM